MNTTQPNRFPQKKPSTPRVPANPGAVIFAVFASLALSLTILSCGIGRPGSASTARAKNADAGRNTGALRVISLAPASTSILLDLGAGNLLVATDSWSTRLSGVPAGLPSFDMMKPDIERIAELAPDILLVSAMTEAGSGVNPFERLGGTGMKVVSLPSSADLAGIEADVTLIAGLIGCEDAGKKTIAHMNEAVTHIEKIARTIPADKRRTVVFEIESAPWIYTFGSGTYLDDLLSRAGAVNAFSREKGWIAVSAEAIIKANPDVILTNVALGDPVAEISGRPGWGAVKAVREGRIYRIDNTMSSQPAPACVRALEEIAEAVYPEYFK